MTSFQEIVKAYNCYDLDSDGVEEIKLLQHLWHRNRSFDEPSEQIVSGRKLVVVIAESSLFNDLTGSHYSVDDLLQRLLTFKHDLHIEGREAKFLEMALYSGPIRQDGKTLLAIREFFKEIHCNFNNFEGAILIGSFPEASIVRNWPQYYKIEEIGEDQYRVGLTPGQPRPFEIVLADLDGNWRNIYQDSVNLKGYIFHVTPSTSVSVDGSKVTLINPTITETQGSLRDVFWIQDAMYNIVQSPQGQTKVELDLTCADPEVSALDKGLPNPVARPDICISRINARSIAVQPPSSRLLDSNGKPHETSNIPPINFSMEAWLPDPKLERALLIDYFDRNHAFRSGKFSEQGFSVSLIESGLGTVAANEGLTGLNAQRDEVLNATLLKFTQWLKRPALFRVIASHADCHATVLRSDDPNAVLDAALVESECGGHPWRWIEEDGKYIPSFNGHYTGDLYLYRTLWENRQLSGLPPSLLLHVGCDVGSVDHGDLPYDNPLYGTFQNAASLLFCANQLAVLCHVTWWNRGPLGFGNTFGASDLAVLGDGWKAIFEHVSQDSDLAKQSTERKQSYIWNLVGDWTLQKYYAAPKGPGTYKYGDKIVAIDPLALVLPGDIYVKLHLPDPPPIEVIQSHIRETVKGMTLEQRKEARTRAKVFIAYAKAMEKELG
jgi:hypothetical protein